MCWLPPFRCAAFSSISEPSPPQSPQPNLPISPQTQKRSLSCSPCHPTAPSRGRTHTIASRHPRLHPTPILAASWSPPPTARVRDVRTCMRSPAITSAPWPCHRAPGFTAGSRGGSPTACMAAIVVVRPSRIVV
ncbi:hypothetical protein SEVIR_9G024450v4 [Setaria viridis]